MKYWLSDDEVSELTKRTKPSAQRKVLDAMGYRYRQRPDGSFIVPTSQFMNDQNRIQSKNISLDFSSLGKTNGKAA